MTGDPTLEAHLHVGSLLIEEDPFQAWLHLRECLRINPLDPRVHVVSEKIARKLEGLSDTRRDWAALAQAHEKALGLISAREEQDVAGPAPEPRGDTAILKIHSRPWARVWLDYQDTGLTTPVYRLEVEPGAHVVGLVAGCRPEPVTMRVVVPQGHTEVIDLELCPQARMEPANEAPRSPR